MAEVKKVAVSGDELERRIRVHLEFSIHDAEAMLNQEMAKAIAAQAAKAWMAKHKQELASDLSVDAIAKEVLRAIVDKAVFQLAIERATP